MNATSLTPHATEVKAAGELYQQAAQALLLAYQRNKQATRHHAQGAFRAALHHAILSVEHAGAAHVHLQNALALSMALSGDERLEVAGPQSTGCAHKDH